MKWAYVYLLNFQKQEANLVQTLNMVYALGRNTTVTYLSPWVSKSNFKRLLLSLGLNQSVNLSRFPVVTSNFFPFQLLSFIVYSICAIVYLHLRPQRIIYTRDFAFICMLSFIPKFFRFKGLLIFEAHKIYHRTSKKIWFGLENRVLTVPDLFIANSYGVKKHLCELFHIKEENVLTLPNGVNLSIFRSQHSYHIPQKHNFIKAKNPIILYTGSFLKWKGVDVLIKSTKYIKTPKTTCVIVGGEGENLVKMNKLVDAYKLHDRVKFLPRIPQNGLIPWINKSDIAVIPNKYDTQGKYYTSPLKLFEYLAAGLPIIASKFDSLKELICEPENCLFFEPENEIDLANKIDILLNDPSLCCQMRKNNLMLAEKYSWNIRSKKLKMWVNEHL